MPFLPDSRTCQGSAHVHYRRQLPEQTGLYQLVQDHVESFYAQVEAQTGHCLLTYVKSKFNAFLDCGILANGFLRLRCEDCHHEKLVTFSCKKRGFCLSCGARRPWNSCRNWLHWYHDPGLTSFATLVCWPFYALWAQCQTASTRRATSTG